MNVIDQLEALKRIAQNDSAVREQLLETREKENPVAAFCEKCVELGYPIYEMDLIYAGEEFYATMKRSTNGGGENSPMLKGQDDFYEMFFADL